MKKNQNGIANSADSDEMSHHQDLHRLQTFFWSAGLKELHKTCFVDHLAGTLKLKAFITNGMDILSGEITIHYENTPI